MLDQVTASDWKPRDDAKYRMLVVAVGMLPEDVDRHVQKSDAERPRKNPYGRSSRGDHPRVMQRWVSTGSISVLEQEDR